MKPVTPILKTGTLKESTFGNVRAVCLQSNYVLTRWHMNFKERLRVLLFGDLYVLQQRNRHKLPLLAIRTDRPPVQ
jgi:hypothetical protein